MKARLILVLVLAFAVCFVIWRGRKQPQQRPDVAAPQPSATISTGVVAAVPAISSSPPAPTAPKAFGATATTTVTEHSESPSTPQVAKPSSSAPNASPTVEEPPPAISPAIALENLRTTVRQYGSMFRGNPVGTNVEITRALNGENPKRVKFLDAGDHRINEKGELIDSWATPYFFHQLAATEMEIRSAGPDKKMWSADDLVIR